VPSEQVVNSVRPEEFLERYLIPRQPIVVRSALADWKWAPPWKLSELERRFGDSEVPLFDTLFTLEDVSTLREYLRRHTRSAVTGIPPYLRWFARQSETQEMCADKAFAELADDWSMPSWLPTRDYVFPRYAGPVDAAQAAFPAKGIFICGSGGRTRLHVDPWASDACLCQATGSKRFIMFPPEAGPLLSDREGTVVDLDRADDRRFPRWREAVPVLDEVLTPGDAIYIPAGWYHTAIAMTDSVSVTWNFVHRVHEERFRAFLAGGSQDPVVSYFLARIPADDSSRLGS
jgi:Cupin-like domain